MRAGPHSRLIQVTRACADLCDLIRAAFVVFMAAGLIGLCARVKYDLYYAGKPRMYRVVIDGKECVVIVGGHRREWEPSK